MFAFYAIFLAHSTAQAYSSGKTNSYATGCTSCHGSTASANTTSTFAASATTVAPGETIDITFTVSSTDSSMVGAGFNVGAPDGGTLAAGSNNKLSSSQVTHSARTSFTSGSVSFDFTWTAPSAEGSYTLQGAGNAVNGNGGYSGDGWSLASDLEIVVDDGCNDLDGDGYEDCLDDCDDTDASVMPGAEELCDGKDNDCDGSSDEDAMDAGTWYADGDGDGYGDDADTTMACDMPEGYAAMGGDCDDADGSYNPGREETCSDPYDYNCDGSVGYTDADGDGWAACDECDDNSASANPDQTEVCDGADNDCDGSVDDEAADASTWYVDGDGDGFGTADATMMACVQPDGYADNADDCDDSNGGVNPAGQETWYDGTDQNCDGNDDDQDGDGAGLAEDCDDADGSIQTGCDTGTPDDTGTGDDTGGAGGDSAAADDSGGDYKGEGCSCDAGATPASLLAIALGALAARRRRRHEV